MSTLRAVMLREDFAPLLREALLRDVPEDRVLVVLLVGRVVDARRAVDLIPEAFLLVVTLRLAARFVVGREAGLRDAVDRLAVLRLVLEDRDGDLLERVFETDVFRAVAVGRDVVRFVPAFAPLREADFFDADDRVALAARPVLPDADLRAVADDDLLEEELLLFFAPPDTDLGAPAVLREPDVDALLDDPLREPEDLEPEDFEPEDLEDPLLLRDDDDDRSEEEPLLSREAEPVDFRPELPLRDEERDELEDAELDDGEEPADDVARLTSLLNRLSFSSESRIASPSLSNHSKNSSHPISSRVSSPLKPGKSIRRTPGSAPSPVRFTRAGLPPRSSTHRRICS